MKIDDFLRRADELIAQGEAVLGTKFVNSHVHYVNAGAIAGFRAAALSFLQNVFGAQHPYFKDFDSRVNRNFFTSAEAGHGIIVAARQELKGGWVKQLKNLVSAEIFSDFMEMAEYLLSEHYKDPAGVLIGSVLEEHLRQLCHKNSIDVQVVKDGKPFPKKAELLNAELAGAGIYSKLDQKAITTWLDIRNKAAHGQYDQYNEQQVAMMLQGVTEFLKRNTI